MSHSAASTDPQLDGVLQGLNPAQREAVLHVDGPALVLAGAGSGKTRVLTTRIARLVGHHRVPPAQILAVTFTNKAAGEMRERIERLLREPLTGMWVGTFHAIGARMLRGAARLAGRTASFTIYDEDDALGVVKRVMERAGISPKEYAPKAILAAISDAKNALVDEREYERLALDPFSRAAAAVYTQLEPALRLANAVTFDDLLVLPVRLLQREPALLAEYRARFRYILVDEYQDTNRAQYQLVKLLGGEHGNVMVVGDEDQSIYGWRGADIRNILDFEKDFPNAHVVRLEENYRSAPPILELANHVISANTERLGKHLRPTLPGGERVTIVNAADERDEADAVLDEIVARRAGGRLRLRDFAILYRTNAQSRAMEEALRRRNVPYRLVGAVRFYDRREIRDLMAYLKLVANPADDEAFRRAIGVPKRGLGDTTIAMLAEVARGAGLPMLAAAERPELLAGLRPAARKALADFVALIADFRERARDAAVDELLRDLVEALHYAEHLRAEGPEGAERLDNVRELIASAAETVADEGGEVGLTPLDHFLQRATLAAGVDGLDPDADAVVMMTMHNAKGLEFPVVFVTGLEDGLFPLARAYDDPAMLEEERRLFYVGITRAERKLVLTHADQRRRNGELLPSKPSSFVAAIPRGMLESRVTTRARSTGRAFLDGIAGGARGGYGGARGGYGGARGGYGSGGRAARGGRDDAPAWSSGDALWDETPPARRRGTPVTFGADRAPAPAEEEQSQDAALIAVGARVRHAKFGAGTIAELAGSGRDTKVRIDFDDESIGRKTLVVAQANLEREWD
ncbi:MAG TPA: UvrD-helicase domain-containing protein [Gemmatimonadaceae bacterium]|nr:UvrD-helicase domain-containing protein [Gemmatimonadaceae bacterium]